MNPTALYPHLALAGSLLAVLGLAWGKGSRREPAAALSAVGLAAALALVLVQGTGLETELVRSDGLSAFWQALFAAGAFALVLVMRSDRELPWALALASVLGMTLMASANHLFVLFLGLELMSLALYMLIPALRKDRLSLEAAVKYFFMGSAASAAFLFGLSIFYASTGSFAMAPAAETGPALGLAMALMGGAALFKVGAAPLHFWLPDAYEAAEPELAGFMSTAAKAAAVLFLMRLLPLVPGGGPPAFSSWLPAAAALTMTAGNLLALRQRGLQRLLAYSSMAHAGYLLAGVWAWTVLGPAPEAAASVGLYLAAYLFMSFGAFLFIRVSGARRVADLDGLGRRAPWLAGFFCLMLLGLASVPPTAGFLAKLFVLWDIWRAGGYWLAAALAVNSLIGFGYYAWLVRRVVLEPPPAGAPAPPAATLVEKAVLAAAAAATLGLGLMPGLWSFISGVLAG